MDTRHLEKVHEQGQQALQRLVFCEWGGDNNCVRRGQADFHGRRQVEADLGKEAGAKTGGGDSYAKQEDASATQEPSEEHGRGQL